MKKVILLLIISLQVLSAQNYVGIHQKQFLKEFIGQKFDKNISDKNEINPLKKTNLKLNKTVFGFLRPTEYNLYRQYLRYDLLTHIAVFPFDVSNDGSISLPLYWPWNDVINAAHNEGCKVIMTATYFLDDQKTVDDLLKLLTNDTVKAFFFSNVASIIKTYKLDGINIDFEALFSAKIGRAIPGFLNELKNYLITNGIINAEVSYASPAVSWIDKNEEKPAYNFADIAFNCDYLFVMAYNYYYAGSETTGPNAPLYGGYFNIDSTVTSQYRHVVPNRIILGLPYYGISWKAEASYKGAKVISHNSYPKYSSAKSYEVQHGRLWDNVSKTPWTRWQEGNYWNQVWFDDSLSLSMKYDYAVSKNLKGIGIWALGYDADRPELWNLLENKFKEPSIVKEENIVEDFKLYQNYPNPFNPSTTIRFKIKRKGNYKLTVYNILSRPVVKVFDEFKEEGEYNVTVDMSNFASGIYFYMLEGNGIRDMKKMSLIK